LKNGVRFQDQVIARQPVEERQQPPEEIRLDGLTAVIAEAQVDGFLAPDPAQNVVDSFRGRWPITGRARQIGLLRVNHGGVDALHLLVQDFGEVHQQRTPVAIMAIQEGVGKVRSACWVRGGKKDQVSGAAFTRARMAALMCPGSSGQVATTRAKSASRSIAPDFAAPGGRGSRKLLTGLSLTSGGSNPVGVTGTSRTPPHHPVNLASLAGFLAPPPNQ
jgi:hypothetical protein